MMKIKDTLIQLKNARRQFQFCNGLHPDDKLYYD